jgi:hypothetical protein
MVAQRTIGVAVPVFNHVFRLEDTITVQTINVFPHGPLVQGITGV